MGADRCADYHQVTTSYAQACGESVYHLLDPGKSAPEAHGVTTCGLVAAFGAWGWYDRRPPVHSSVTSCPVCFTDIRGQTKV
jgi:hypothetical protein